MVLLDWEAGLVENKASAKLQGGDYGRGAGWNQLRYGEWYQAAGLRYMRLPENNHVFGPPTETAWQVSGSLPRRFASLGV